MPATAATMALPPLIGGTIRVAPRLAPAATSLAPTRIGLATRRAREKPHVTERGARVTGGGAGIPALRTPVVAPSLHAAVIVRAVVGAMRVGLAPPRVTIAIALPAVGACTLRTATVVIRLPPASAALPIAVGPVAG